MAVEINWLEVAVGTAITFVLGGVWYGPLFGKTWQRAMGLSDEELKRTMGRTFAIAIVLAFISCANLSAFIGRDASVTFGLAAGAAAGVGWVATSLGTTYAFGRRPLRLALIDAGYHAVSFTAVGALFGAWS